MNKAEILKGVEKEHMRQKRIPRFDVGDVVKISLKIKEGEKERLQAFEGVIIGKSGAGINETIKVRRIASGVGVERTLLINSPMIQDFKVMKRGEVNRAKLYYLRGKTGKHAKIKQMRREKLLQIQTSEAKAIEEEQAESARQAAAEAAAKDAEAKAQEKEQQQSAESAEAKA